ncbi:MAG: complex I subunit 1 family protein [bacterium]
MAEIFTPEIVNLLVRGGLLIFVLLTTFAYLTYTERRVLSFFQWRLGPNRVGPLGLLQPLADGVKTALKQEMVPRKADKVLYFLAPTLTLSASFTTFALIPVGERVQMSSVPVAILFFLGLSSMAAYGLILAGWSSQSKYPFLGSLRTCAQVISYELALGLCLLVPILITGSLNINDFGNMYRAENWNWIYLIVLLPTTVLFLISSLAETGRTPFDLPECEAEIVAGYHTEYSSMKYAMFPMGEYIAMVAMSAMVVHMLLGGYHLDLGFVDLTYWAGDWKLGPLESWGWGAYGDALSLTANGFATTMTFIVKLCALIFTFMWIRATFPRLRYDQLMRFGWKWLLKATLVLIFVTAALVGYFGPVQGAGADTAAQAEMEVTLNARH